MPDETPATPADPVARPEQPPMDDAAGPADDAEEAMALMAARSGNESPSDVLPTEAGEAEADSAAHPS